MMYAKHPNGRSAKTLSQTGLVVAALTFGLAGVGFMPAPAWAAPSDLNHDGVVDLQDLIFFSNKYLDQDWQTVDWCAWIAEDGRLQNKRDHLVDFIREYFQCDVPPEPPGPDPLAVENENTRPTRLAWGPNGKLYVSDARVRSVFIYDLVTDPAGQTTLNLTGELKRVGHIVAVAVSSAGEVYVGNSLYGRVQKYNLDGEMIGIIGDERIRMPTDLTFDANGNLYVADIESDVVWVYKPDGSLLRTIRRGGLKKPMSVEIAYHTDPGGNKVGELFVASNGDYLVKVFDLKGNLLRSFGGFVEKEGWFNPIWVWQGKFVSLQSLAVDANGNVHVLDSYMNRAQILDASNGDFLSSYGESGTAAGQFLVPLDLIISPSGVVILANADNRRVEIVHQVP